MSIETAPLTVYQAVGKGNSHAIHPAADLVVMFSIHALDKPRRRHLHEGAAVSAPSREGQGGEGIRNSPLGASQQTFKRKLKGPCQGVRNGPYPTAQFEAEHNNALFNPLI